MSTPEGIVRRITAILSAEQTHEVTDALEDCRDCIEGLLKSERFWLQKAADHEAETLRSSKEVVRLRKALNQIAWPGAWGIRTDLATTEMYRHIAVDALAIGASVETGR